MHIGFITPEYPHSEFSGHVGGIGTFTKNIAEQLIKKGCRVSVFIHSQSHYKIKESNGVIIHFVKKKKVKGFTWYANRMAFNDYVNSIIKKENIKVIEAPEWTGFTAFMKFNCPIVLRLHGSDTYFCNLESRKVKPKNKFFEKRALLAANYIVAVSDFVAVETKRLFKLKKTITTIYNGIDADEFSPLQNGATPKSLLYFGTLIRKKGVLEIPEVFNRIIKKHPDLTLTFIGRDNVDIIEGCSTKDIIIKKLSNKALNAANFIQAVPYSRVKEHIANADIVLLPSFAEAFPMTWLEAMSMKKKIITSNIGWANELMIDGKTGFTVYPKNHDEFSKKLLDLIEKESDSLNMAENARQRIVECFDNNNKVEENINFYKSIVNEF